MALRVSASSVALCLLFSLMAVAHCVPLEEAAGDLATDASPAAVTAVPDDEEDILRFGVALEGEAPMEEEEVVNPVAEPDPDRSHPEEELTALKPSSEIEKGEKKKEQIGDDEDEEEEEEKEKKSKKNHDGGDKDEKKEKTKNKRKKHDCKEKKKTKKHEQSNGEGEEKLKKQIYRHHHVEKEKTKNRPYRNSGSDSDDEDEQEKKVRRWRKAISRRSRFGHGRRSQREESQTQEVKN